jgi:EAL domain-containing protein (putative c-di-GMP-specific phosphodiesterase class I)
VNISPQHLERGDLVEQLLREQQRSGADLRGLTVEITETVMLQAQAEAQERLLQLKAAGVRIALDDFGTGYSSLAWLSRLPVDAVKLDQTYVQQMAEDERCALLVRGFVRVFQEMGLQVVAEGIETEEQRQRLLEMGCHLGQGYLFGRPAPLNAAPWDATVD